MTTGRLPSVEGGIQPTIVDAKGDIIAATAADTVSRLAVGANNTVLTADSSTATGLKWAAPAGGGKVLQVVQGSYATETTIASTSLTDTGLSASITPSATSSKILILVTQIYTLGTISGGVNMGIGMAILRGSTSILAQPVNALVYYGATDAYDYFRHTITLQYLDSPSTTSSTTYKTQGQLSNTSNRELKYQQEGTTSFITLLEIGA